MWRATIGLDRIPGQHDVVVRAGDAACGLGEDHGLGRHRQSRLGGMVAVVETDRDEFADACVGSSETWSAAHHGQSGDVDGPDLRELFRGQVRGRQIPERGTEIADLTAVIQQAGLLETRAPVA
jgi:hypothetical protein